MGRKEEPMIAYYNDPGHFADLMNGWIYRGEKKLTAEQIQETDSRYTAETNRKYRTRYRDIAKRVKNIRVVLVVGTEIQSYVDYSMSPIAKEDRLIPAITLVLYMGEEPWDAADNLHEILDFSNVTDEWKEYIQNYKVHVLDICHTPDERLMEFPNDIASMFLFIKYAKDKKKLAELVHSSLGFSELESDTVSTLLNYVEGSQVRKIKKTWETVGGKIDMRSALDEIYEDGVAIGEKRGEKRGITIGEKRGITIGEKRGITIGEKRGITIGKEYGISSMLELLQELGYCEDDAKFHLENKFQLSGQEADSYIKKYWNGK